MSGLARIFPLFSSLRGYDRSDARSDLVAGLTTAVMLIPQGMGYAMLAGLPPIYGLYAALLPLVLYGLLGTSRQLAVGPAAMVSLLIAAGVGELATAGSPPYIAYAIALSVMVGVLQLVMGVARLGFLVNFLSHPVITGFTAAAALIIASSQLEHLLGYPIPRSSELHETLLHAGTGLDRTHLATALIGGLALVALVLLKRWAPAFPRALAVVAAGSLAVWGLGPSVEGVAIVGHVPEGLPAPRWPRLDWTALRELLPIALTISFVGFMESIAVAKRYARKLRYQVDANRELIALGVANLGGAATQAFPVTGGFGRTAVNAQAGARTGLASIITAATIALTLSLLTPLVYYLPKAVLAAIIMAAVVGLIDVDEVKHLWRVKRADLAMLAITFVATLGLGIEEGIVVGVGASLVALVVKSTRPHVAVLGRLPGTDSYRNVKNYPEAQTTAGILALRLDAQLYFGNVNFLQETLSRAESEEPSPLFAVVLDASGMNQIDASGEAAFREILEEYRSRGVALLLANVKGPVRAVLERSGFVDTLGRDRMFLSVHDAIDWALENAESPRSGRQSSDRLVTSSNAVALAP